MEEAKMKKLIMLIGVSVLAAGGFVQPETGWEFFQSQKQGFLMLLDIEVNGDQSEVNEPFTDANGNGSYDLEEEFEDINGDGIRQAGDVVGAFINRDIDGDGIDNVVCVGWKDVADGFTTVALMGDDGDKPGMLPGEVPYVLLYDRTYDNVIPISLDETFYVDLGLDGCPDLYEDGDGGCNCDVEVLDESSADFCDIGDENGVDDPNGDNSLDPIAGTDFTLFAAIPGWAEQAIYLMQGVTRADQVFGCAEEDSCNFDVSVTANDGSCWYPVDGCSCDDPEGAVVDCAGVCDGTAAKDACDICSGGSTGLAPNTGESLPENGDYFVTGPDADCAGVCFGDSYVDACGTCDNEASNDNLVCTGCTDGCAFNYVETDLFDAAQGDDGACSYTVEGIDGLEAASGPARVVLTFGESEGAKCVSGSVGPAVSYNVYSLDVVNYNFDFIKSTSNTTTQVLNLNAGEEYCFSVSAVQSFGGIDWESDLSDPVCAQADVAGGISWGLQLKAGINGYGVYSETDDFNYLGVAGNGTDGYDVGLDFPEPPFNTAANYIALYFKHPEWGNAFGDFYTQDVRSEDSDIYENELVVWEADVLSNMHGNSTIQINYFNTPSGVPMYYEFDGGPATPVEDGSLIEFFLQEGIPKTLKITIGNIPPQAADNFVATGGDRDVTLSWDDDDQGLYPSISYNIYRDGNLIANVNSSPFTDDEDQGGYEGQGLLYESSYDYTITSVNAAGESDDGHNVNNHDGTDTSIAGRQSDDSATTDDNLDPIAITVYIDSEDGTNIEDGVYEIPHNNDIDANKIGISIDGSNSSDDDDFDTINSYTWTQVDGPDDLSLENHDQAIVSFSAHNANGGDDKVYELNLNVTSDYPTKEGIKSRDDNSQISVIILDEPNDAPIAPSPYDIIVTGDGSAVYNMDDANAEDEDGNDYDASTYYWVVPHDGDPLSDTAHLYFTALASTDPEGDDLTYSWDTGLEPEPYTDLNGDGVWSVNEPFEDLDTDGQWDNGDLAFDDYDNLDVLRLAGDYTFHLTITDVYGATATADIVVGVQGEYNEAPTSNAG
ncbi:MAG: hypothetical protein CMG00_01935, partial [Candidatus Marinimicrobia bacterium]|nr:hypothetical protein [Candidatus Neomarinimicrobiota bacterium]